MIAFGVAADVISRTMNLGGISWMFETVEYALLFMTLVAAAYVLRENRHVTIDVGITIIPESWRRPVAIVANTVATLICATFIYCGVLAAYDSYQAGANIYKSFTIKEWVPIALVPPTFVLVTIECLRRLKRSLDRGERKKETLDIGY